MTDRVNEISQVHNRLNNKCDLRPMAVKQLATLIWEKFILQVIDDGKDGGE